MAEQFCIRCLRPLSDGQDICPYCGISQSATFQFLGRELLPLQELADGRYKLGMTLDSSDELIGYLGLDRETGGYVRVLELFPVEVASRGFGQSSVSWQTSEEDWNRRRQEFAEGHRGEAVFFQNNTAYAVTPYEGEVPGQESWEDPALFQEAAPIPETGPFIPETGPSIPETGNVDSPQPRKKSKKALIAIIAAACAVVVIAGVVLAIVLTRSNSDWLYTAADGYALLTGTKLEEAELELPATLGDQPVTVIDRGAFQDNSLLRAVTIPEGVTEIGVEAFSGCEGLEDVTLPSSLTRIGASAFAGCKSLKRIVIPSGVKTIEEAVFSGCGALEDVTVPEGVTSIGRMAFANCGSLKNLVLPESLTSIGAQAFLNCTGMTHNPTPASVTSLSDSAFEGCDFPDDVRLHSLESTILETSPRGYLDYSVVIEPQYEDAKLFSYHLAAVKMMGKWGYINEDNEVVIPFDYIYAWPFNEGYAVVATEEREFSEGLAYRLGFIDVDNQYTPFRDLDGNTFWTLADDLDPEYLLFHNGLVTFMPAGTDRYFSNFFGTDGRMVNLGNGPDGEPWRPVGPMNEGVAPVLSNLWFGWVNDSFDLVYSDEIEINSDGSYTYLVPAAFNQGIAPVYCYMWDANGEMEGSFTIFVNRDFEMAFEDQSAYFDTYFFINGLYTVYQLFGSAGLAALAVDEQFGAIDKDGNAVIPFQYELTIPESEGLFVFQQDGKQGFISADRAILEKGDMEAAVVVPAQYEMATAFSRGFAAVYDGESAYLIDREGNTIEGTENLDTSSYFVLDDDGNVTSLRSPEEYLIVKESGQYGFARLEYYPELPDRDEISEELYEGAASAIAEELVPTWLQNLYHYDIMRQDMTSLIVKAITKIQGTTIEEFVEEKSGTPLTTYIRNNKFQDTPSEDVIACAALNIVMGSSETEFNPYGHITRQEAAAFLQRTAMLLGVKDAEGEEIVPADAGDVASYFTDSVAFVLKAGIMDLDENGAFSPLDNFTREEAYAAVYRLLRVVTGE